LDLKSLPEHLIVIGAGYIGLELGQLFHDFGSRVTLIQRGELLLRSYDPEIGECISSILQSRGMDIVMGATFVNAEQSGTTRRLASESDRATTERRHRQPVPLLPPRLRSPCHI